MKIDCSKTENFIKEKERMCKSHDGWCDGCPIYKRKADTNNKSCSFFILNFTKKAIEIVQKWSDEHPVKTRLEDLKEKYPKAPISHRNTPNVCTKALGYTDECIKYTTERSTSSCEDCWNMPI